MSLADVSHGPDWVIWIVFAIFVALAVTFLTGHGSSLIAVTILVTALLEDQLPMEAAYVIAGIIFVDAIVMIILGNTVCRRR